nr:MAG TPA: hypothetical protein [Caudoviricetes sp.]
MNNDRHCSASLKMNQYGARVRARITFSGGGKRAWRTA